MQRMGLGQITLYKKTSTARISILSDEDADTFIHFKELYTTTGNFQYMEFTDLSCVNGDAEGFSKIIEYSAAKEICGVRYALHPMFFYFDLEEQIPFCSPNLNHLKESSFFTLGVLKLSKSETLIKNYGSADKMLSGVKADVNKYIKRKGYKKWKDPDNPPSLGLYPLLSSADMLFIACGSNPHDLMEIWPLLRSVPLRIIQESLEQSNGYIFRLSNSFLAVHNTFNLTNAKDLNLTANMGLDVRGSEKISAVINYSLTDVTKVGTLCEIFRKLLKDSQMHYYVYGTYDIALFVDDCPLDILLYAMGVRHSGDMCLEYGKSAKMYIEFERKYVGTSHVRLICRGQLGNENAPLRQSSEKDIIFDSVSVKQKEDHNKDRAIETLKTLQLSVSELELLSTQAQRTLDFLIDKCIGLLSLDYRYLTGCRMFRLIERALYAVLDNPGEFSSEHINFNLGRIRSMLSTVLMAESLRIDTFGGDDAETINPFVKVYFALENIIRKLFSAVNDKNNKFDNLIPSFDKKHPLFFVTMDPTELGTHLGLAHFGRLSGICSTNLPPVFKDLLSLVCHEFGHHIHESTELRIMFNKAFLEFIKMYIMLFVRNFVVKRDLSFNRVVYLKYMRNLFETEEYCFDFENSSCEVFMRQCIDYTKFLSRNLGKLVNPDKTEFADRTQYESNEFYRTTSVALGILSQNRDYFTVLMAAFDDARADSIMNCLGMYYNKRYRYKRYLETHFKYLKESKPANFIQDATYKIRLAAVLAILSKDKDVKGHMDDVRKYCNSTSVSESNKPLLISAIDFWDENSVMLKPLTDYLLQLDKYIAKQISGAKNKVRNLENALRLIQVPLPSDMESEQSESLGDFAKRIYSEWFEGLSYWGGEDDEQ